MAKQLLDGFIEELLHINEVSDNKLIDLGASNGKNTFYLTHTCISQSAYTLGVIAERRGNVGNTILLNSALASSSEQRISRHINTFDWHDANNQKDVKALHTFITNAKKDLTLRGNNPLFLSVGALRWRVSVQSFGKEVAKDILTPLLVFPIRIVVTSNSAPAAIEFIDDDIYVNPCLTAKLAQIYGEEIAADFPMPKGTIDDKSVVDLGALGDGESYFAEVKKYIDSCIRTDGENNNTLFEFDKEVIAISQYNHSEICTYYDIRRNRDRIERHPLVEKLFSFSADPVKPSENLNVVPKFILPYDSVQADIITRVVNGESMVIKGPPGTGKTVTIANMISALLSENKRVMLVSKKISALNEVYAKLPDSLRKFAMLLDSETEAKAAKINPAEVKQDFKRLLSACKDYVEPVSLERDASHAMAQRSKLFNQISAYIDLMFNDKCIADDSFYAAMDAFCKIDMPVVRFTDPAVTALISRDAYNKMYSAVEKASVYYSQLTADGGHSIWLCPWFNVDDKCDVEKAMVANKEIGSLAATAHAEVSTTLSRFTANASGLTLNEVISATQCVLSERTILDVIHNEEALKLIAELEAKLIDYYKCLDEFGEGYIIKREDDTDRTLIALGAVACDKELKLTEIKSITDNAGIFFTEGNTFAGEKVTTVLATVADQIAKLSIEKEEALSHSFSVFKKELTEEQSKLICKSAPALATYNGESDKPKALDFKAKGAYTKLCELSFLSNPTFGEVVTATAEYFKASELQGKIDEKIQEIYRCFKKQLSDDELQCALLVASKCTPDKVKGFIDSAIASSELLFKCAQKVGKGVFGGLTVGQLVSGYQTGYKLLLVREELARINQIIPVYNEGEEGKAISIASSLCAVKHFKQKWAKIGGLPINTAEAFNLLHNIGQSTLTAINGVLTKLADFGKRYFKNYFTVTGGLCTFEELDVLNQDAENRDVIGAAIAYSAIKCDPNNVLDLIRFFYPFEKEEIKLPEGITFADAFEHSFFALAVELRNKTLGVARNGLGNGMEGNLDKLRSIEESIFKYNVDLIEGRCLRRIKPDDNDFIFIQDNNPGENLRLMFKKHGEGVLKLKKCMILSPYTASLLFRSEQFNDFDVLIVDEASQLEPALMLPVMFRSKQCVIVGDEWQMPPIKHFVTLSPVTGEEEEGYDSLEPEISALGLALRSENFPVKELICHYRSKTESLIKFSQKLFYPNMRTFPAPVPARLPEKGIEGLGFNDVYVPDGVVSKGVNEVEAAKAVEELKKHFDAYYDEESGKLSMSVGVVAFGEDQCTAIQSRVKADKELNRKMSKALENFDDLPEKLIFFKTIETVQGQEIGHLILSLTHGRRSTGLHMSFGQLNQGKLGRCIFNVAVTRAQSMVTVIHSIRAIDITSDSISYIRDYLETVERFCTVGRDQFVSKQVGRGFISQVADYICSQGIARERIVFNYGVTDGSVRLPIAILSRDLKTALLGIWCEVPVGSKYNYLDYNLRYPSSLKRCGWKLHTISIHDWVDNNLNEKKALLKAMEEINL
ncbi:MAG: AAA domain-containing protein [Candidatus Coproplasma sp.]